MNAPLFRALILVTFAVVAACAPARADRRTQRQPPAEKFAELWQLPARPRVARSVSWPGGADAKPAADVAYTWISTDTTGYSPGYEVRGPDGRTWSVKLGPEAQSEVVASRVLWAIGYHQPATYYVPSWQLAGGPGGQQQAGRFRLESDDAEVIGDWSWADNEFLGTQPYQGLDRREHSAEQLGLEDVEQQDLSRQERHVSSRSATSCAISARRSERPNRPGCCGFFPFRCAASARGRATTSTTSSRKVSSSASDEDRVEFDFHTIYGSVVDHVHPSSVRWAAEWLESSVRRAVG